MQTRDTTIRVQGYGGTWGVYGVEYARGVWPENVTSSANLWGSDAASFDLKRDPGVTWPDIVAFSPVEIEVGGQVVWTGRVKETPIRDGSERVVNVQCEGWQYHLDDDAYQKTYVHTSLTDFKDQRSFPTQDLTKFQQGANVSNDNGSIVIGYPNGFLYPGTGSYVGVKLDLGAGQTFTTISVDYETSNNTPAMSFYVSGHSLENLAGTLQDAASFAINASASGTVSGSIATPARYVALTIYYPGAAVTGGVDVWVKITGVRVYGSSAYQSAGASILKASTVINDAVVQGTRLLSTDTTGVQASSFSIPDLTMDGPKTPREMIQAVNAYHDWITKVDADKRMIFKAKPTTPDLEVGAWTAMELQDASANSGEDIYNKVIVTGQTPAGQPVSDTRISPAGTLPERHGFARTKILPVNAALPSDLVAADLIGDTYLTGHKSTPFKGTVTISAGVRNLRSGTNTPLEALLTRTGELLRFSDRADPDTAGWGRDGRIAAVSYDHAKDQATVTIDNSRAVFESLLSRFSVAAAAG